MLRQIGGGYGHANSTALCSARAAGRPSAVHNCLAHASLSQAGPRTCSGSQNLVSTNRIELSIVGLANRMVACPQPVGANSKAGASAVGCGGDRRSHTIPMGINIVTPLTSTSQAKPFSVKPTCSENVLGCIWGVLVRSLQMPLLISWNVGMDTA